MYFRISTFYYCLLLLLFIRNNNYNKKLHSIELYEYNSISRYNFFSHITILLESGLKNIYNACQIISNIQEDSLKVMKYLDILHQKIILLKNENIPIHKKVMKLFMLIQENIPNQKEQEFIVKLYKKILKFFL